MKTAKKIFKIIGIIAGVVVAVLIVYIIYLYASYHRIEDNLSLEVESHAQANAYLTTEKEYCLKRFRGQENWSDLMIRILP